MTDKPQDKSKTLLASDQERQAFLAKVRQSHPAVARSDVARLIFALDATASRERAWDLASHYHAEMFEAAHQHSALDIQLCYYRGYGEFQASPWCSDARNLSQQILSVTCLAGRTQIRKVLEHALRATVQNRVHAVVFVGDCVEEEVDVLGDLAGQLGIRKIPLFIFQDGNNGKASRAFSQLAKLSGGAHCRFDASSARELADLLGAVASYVSGGRKALDALALSRGKLVAGLLEQLK